MPETLPQLGEGPTEYGKSGDYRPKKMNTELKIRILTIIKSNSVQLSECVKDGNKFTAMGITFNIDSPLVLSNAEHRDSEQYPSAKPK